MTTPQKSKKKLVVPPAVAHSEENRRGAIVEAILAVFVDADVKLKAIDALPSYKRKLTSDDEQGVRAILSDKSLDEGAKLRGLRSFFYEDTARKG